jgi:hypothetical protein
MDQKIDLERLYHNQEIRSARSRKSLERDLKIFQAQTDLIQGRYIYFYTQNYNYNNNDNRIIIIRIDI